MAMHSIEDDGPLVPRTTLAISSDVVLDPKARVMKLQEACHLCRLPRELADSIYSLIFSFPQIDEMNLLDARLAAPKDHQIQLSCRRINNGAIPVIESVNRHFWHTTKFDIPDLHAPHLLHEITSIRAQNVDRISGIAVTKASQFCFHVDTLTRMRVIHGT